jgi:pimeloyl-ACP methyl ester carboxylesterase
MQVEEFRLESFQGNGITIRYCTQVPQSNGPVKGLVLCLHGWPESWYSWRHQLRALSKDGFHVVAPDMRGYGGTSQPKNVDEYNVYRLAGDALALIQHLGYTKCFLVGHDWGSQIGYWLTMLHPTVFVAYAGMSVPCSLRKPGQPPPSAVQKQRFGDPVGPTAEADAQYFYMLHHHMPDVAAQYERHLYETLYRLYANTPGNVPADPPEVRTKQLYVQGQPVGFWARLPRPHRLPAWLTEADFTYYLNEFRQAGMEGGVMYYRVMDINHACTEHALSGTKLTVPHIFLAGKGDSVVTLFGGPRGVVRAMSEVVATPELTEAVRFYDGVGHWVQQEVPDLVNAELISFFNRHLTKLVGAAKL